MSGSLKEDGETERAVVSWWWDTTSGVSPVHLLDNIWFANCGSETNVETQ
jgi:hypothetical protein